MSSRMHVMDEGCFHVNLIAGKGIPSHPSEASFIIGLLLDTVSPTCTLTSPQHPRRSCRTKATSFSLYFSERYDEVRRLFDPQDSFTSGSTPYCFHTRGRMGGLFGLCISFGYGGFQETPTRHKPTSCSRNRVCARLVATDAK